MAIEQTIINLARAEGASIAGIAGLAALRTTSSHLVQPGLTRHDGIEDGVDGSVAPDQPSLFARESVGAVLVIGLAHPADRPELDWWDGRGTAGNRLLIEIVERIRRSLASTLQVGSRGLHYYVEKGGVFLKDAAVLAGLGCVGRNNLLITPTYGPRIRLRGMFLDRDLRSTGPVAFDPCAPCPALCRSACPQQALALPGLPGPAFAGIPELPARDGAYRRAPCAQQMKQDETRGRIGGRGQQEPVRYCRRCELACPVGLSPDLVKIDD